MYAVHDTKVIRGARQQKGNIVSLVVDAAGAAPARVPADRQTAVLLANCRLKPLLWSRFVKNSK